MSNQSPKKRNKVRIRWWHVVLIAVVVVCFLGLAYWQWTRFQSGSGTFQNLGYAFQWPLFAAFVIYAYRTAINYENERIEAENDAEQAGDADFTYQAHPAREKKKTAIDESFLPQRPHVDVEEYNQMVRPRRGHHETDQQI